MAYPAVAAHEWKNGSMKTLTMVLAAAAPLALAQSSTRTGNVPVAALDLDRYAGQWHEIGHLPMFFQRQCVDRITATYTRQPDGTIEVRNASRTKAGGRDESTGVARTADGRPGALQVRFAPRALSWLPMVWADYWVIDLDPDYRWTAVVGRAASTCGCCRASRRCRARSSSRSPRGRGRGATRSTRW